MDWGKILLDFGIGLATGILSGFGVGGGTLLIVYLTTFAGVKQFTAAGVNLLYFLFCAPAALVSHIKNKLIDKKCVLVCVLAGLLTSVGAAVVASFVDVSLLRRLFGALLLYVGVKELFHKKQPNDKKEKEEQKKNADAGSP